jgi:hypothetical protein
MMPMPKLWQVLTADWVPLAPDLARAWWYAVAHARWSLATAWREQFLQFARQEGMVTREYVTDFFAKAATLHQLIALVEWLMQEQVLLRRDGKTIEEALLAQADAHGQWKHGQGPERPERRRR